MYRPVLNDAFREVEVKCVLGVVTVSILCPSRDVWVGLVPGTDHKATH